MRVVGSVQREIRMDEEQKKQDKKRRQHEAWKRWYEKNGKDYYQKRKEREAIKPEQQA
jgi:hypothetical protein